MDWDGEKQSAKDIFAGFIRSGLPRPLGILVPVWLAYEALMICGEYGLKPGKDFRLVCCSGIPARELLLPGVSGVEMPFETLSSSISGYFYNVLNSNSEAIVPSVKIPVKFIELDT